MKKICIVAGARPNFIKVAPVIRAIRNAQEAGNEISYQLVYTGKENDHFASETTPAYLCGHSAMRPVTAQTSLR